MRRLLPFAALVGLGACAWRTLMHAADWSRHLTDPCGPEILEFPLARPTPEPRYTYGTEHPSPAVVAEMADLAARDAARQGGK